MDILDFVPFLEFIRNDEETISIIAEASVVIPKVCDILGISLSDSEAEDDTTRNETERPESGQSRVETGSDIPGSQDNQRPRQALPSASMTLQNIFNSHAKDNNPAPSVAAVGASTSGLRKRGSNATVSPRTAVVTGATPSSSIGQASQNLVLPPKKRRVQNSAGSDSSTPRATCTSQNSASTESSSPTATTTVGDDSVKEKLRQDIDSFNEKIRLLAGLERRKNQLLESLLKISTEITQQRSPSEDNNVEETEGEVESSAESDISDDDDDDDDGSDFDSDELDDDEEEEFEETETTEVVEEQIVSLDMMDVIHQDEPNNY